MSLLIPKGKTNVSIELTIIDGGDGTPETGVVFDTSGIDLKYRRQHAAAVSITEADLTTPALTDAHEDGGFLHIGNGVYRLDLPDAVCAAGADQVVVFGTVTGMVVLPVVIQLVDVDIFDAVRAGLTALPNAAADGAGGLAISDAGGLDLDALVTAVTAIQAVTDNLPDSGALNDLAAILTDTGTTLDGKIDAIQAVTDNLPDSGALTTLLSNVAAILTDTGTTLDGKIDAIDTVVDAIKAVTDLLPDSGALSDLAAILTDTDTTIPGLIAALNDFDPASDTVDVGAIDGDTTAAARLALSALGIVPFTVGASATTTNITTNLTEATDDHYNGRTVVMLTGDLAGQATDITDYTGSSKDLTVTALTEAPAENDTGVII